MKKFLACLAIIFMIFFICFVPSCKTVPPKVYSQTPELVAEKDGVKVYRFYQWDQNSCDYLPVYFTDHGVEIMDFGKLLF